MERIFGITGGVGMGKTKIGELLARRGVTVIDTDVIARQVVEPGQPALGEIAKRFGASIVRPDGTLDRDGLARRVFSDKLARADLEAILHPRIHVIWKAAVDRWREEAETANVSRSRSPYDRASPAVGAVVIPLLFETNSAPLFDATICAVCSFPTQAQRLHERGWTEEQSKQRIDAQWPIERKVAQSDYVVWTDTTLDAVDSQLDKILHRRPDTQGVPWAG